MTTRANYIIFHPDYAREQVNVTGEAIVGSKLKRKWNGHIWVDAIGKGNEDPFIFNRGWIYSYCHASQLRRKVSSNYLQRNSWLIFCSGDSANNHILCVDTVFQVEHVHDWIQNPHLALPVSFSGVRRNNSNLWERHLKFPFHGQHPSVSHSYEAALGRGKSFLPLKDGYRFSLDFAQIPSTVRIKITENVRGKYPVNLTDPEADSLVNLIRFGCDTQVLRVNQLQNDSNLRGLGSC